MVLCGLILAVVIAGAVNAARHIHRSRHPWLYGCYACGLVLGVAGVTYWLRRSHELHLHHFFNCAVLIPFTGFDDPVSAVSQAPTPPSPDNPRQPAMTVRRFSPASTSRAVPGSAWDTLSTSGTRGSSAIAPSGRGAPSRCTKDLPFAAACAGAG